MSLSTTLILLVFSIVFGGICAWRGAQPLDLKRSTPRMMPWRFLMLLCAALTMLLLIHLAGLFGAGPQPPAY
ncbi:MULTISPECIES: hypothetical protein [unclassified Brevundimonas]|uniref:hypothetical protein n=1 Tax=unclassified Brevundimonas TaxID=2622653 RepID=UPI0025C0FAE7|nr:MULTISPECIES: hypothetical protein [unclassified Brevundimonas]